MRKLFWILPWAVVVSSSDTTIRYEGVFHSPCNDVPQEACQDFVDAMNTAHDWREKQEEPERVYVPDTNDPNVYVPEDPTATSDPDTSTLPNHESTSSPQQ